MKKILIVSLCYAFLLPGFVPAATKAFYVTDEGVDNQFVVRLKNFSAAPVGLYVQKCISGPSGANDFAAPTNWGWAFSGNAFTNYLPPDCYEYQVGTCFMGDDDSAVGFTPSKPGQVSGDIGSADTTRRGWLRTFSDITIPASAYYGDTLGATAGRTLNNAVNVYQWQSDPVVSNVNPAYVIPFSVAPPTQTIYATFGGTLTVGSGVNVLPETILLVEYRSQSGGAWMPFDTTIAANGAFEGTVAGPFPNPVFVRARVIDGASPRPGLPLSSEYPVNVLAPEPGTAGIALLAIFALLRRKHFRN